MHPNAPQLVFRNERGLVLPTRHYRTAHDHDAPKAAKACKMQPAVKLDPNAREDVQAIHYSTNVPLHKFRAALATQVAEQQATLLASTNAPAPANPSA